MKETFFSILLLLFHCETKKVKEGRVYFGVGVPLQLECVPSAWHSVAFSSVPAEPLFSRATPAINWPDSCAVSLSWSEPEDEREKERGDGAKGKREGIKRTFGSRVCSQTQFTLCSK